MKIWNGSDLEIRPLNDNAGYVMQHFYSQFPPKTIWLGTGTALGLYRDKDFIKGDCDIDFLMSGYPTMDEGYTQGMIGALYQYKLVRTIYDNDLVQQLCFMKDGILVDIYYFYEDGDNYSNHSESGWLTMPKHLFDDRKELSTKYGAFYFPNPIETYLAISYGTDWNVPMESKPNYSQKRSK